MHFFCETIVVSIARETGLPNGQLPVLDVDGFQLAQSLAILRYVGKLGGKSAHSTIVLTSFLAGASDTTPLFPHRRGNVFFPPAVSTLTQPLQASTSTVSPPYHASRRGF